MAQASKPAATRSTPKVLFSRSRTVVSALTQCIAQIQDQDLGTALRHGVVVNEQNLHFVTDETLLGRRCGQILLRQLSRPDSGSHRQNPDWQARRFAPP